ncbi:RNA polymerase sigma factor [Flavilitoribacter nigricans]|uniref:RNA polymerase subunit sigma-70 n=1 Tax=Flavilitoribacter nigricans (strain ATCC 23147 / DSM 23189 / NBRC 102662 / NCIMB 1420 / SS-2) TaxID=1122177 RepID=A0A2D0NC71_FLAN2|nr:RNA polymerase sigma factor [Flavilitoribacter nigricans]PHN05363.1 RNA polymerase subunit sigma-70 [Flavilitoribacter nigricans DSM 23189 = NBRC 102662]
MKNEKALIVSISQGDQNAFRAVYELYADKVYNTALSYAQNKEDAEEITQDVFTKVFRNAAQFEGRSGVSTWIYRITVNTSLSRLKKRKRFSLFGMGTSVPSNRADFDHPGILLEKKEDAKALFRAIDTLPATQKTAFILSFVEELPRQEVADIMEISLKAVESLLQRGKKNLRIKLEKMYLERRKK